MNNEFEDFDRALSEVTADLNIWDSSLSKNTKLLNLSSDAKKLAALELDEEDSRRKALTAQAKSTISQLGTFAQSLSSSGGSFEPLAKAVDMVGDVIDGVASAFGPWGALFGAAASTAAKTTSLLIRSMDKAYGTFEKLSQSGVVTSFSEMQEQAASAGLNLDDFQKIFSKNSKDLAVFAGTATKGTSEISKLGMYSDQLRIQMQRLGVSAADMVDLQTSVLVQQSRAQGTMIKINSDTVRITDEYITNLSAVSKLTGASIKQLDDFNKQLQNSVRYRLGIQNDKNITDEGQKSIKLFLQTVNASAPKLEAIVEEAIVNDGGMTSPEGVAVSNLMGDKWIKFTQLLRDAKAGKVAGGDLAGIFARDMQAQLLINKSRIAQGGEKDPLYNIAGQLLDFSDKNMNTSQKVVNDLLASAEIQKHKTDDLNGQVADTKSSMYRASQQIEQLATNSDIVASLMQSMAETMNDLTSAAYKVSGRKKSDSVVAQDNVVQLEKDLKDLKIKINYYSSDPIGSRQIGASNIVETKKKQALELEEKIRKAKLKQTEAEIREGMRENAEIERQNSAAHPDPSDTSASQDQTSQDQTTQAPAPQAPSTRPPTPPYLGGPQTDAGSASGMVGGPKDTKAYDGLKLGGNGIVNGVPEAIAGGPSSARLIGIAKQMQAAYPGGIFNAFNDKAHNKNDVHGRGLAFDFGLPANAKVPSNNQQGKFFGPSKAKGKEIVAQLQGWGASYAKDEYNDPSHGATGGHIHAQVSARTGGILDGPDSGYLAELHGDEMVVPTEGGVSKQPLNTGGIMGDSSSSNEITSLYDSLSKKMGRLVDLLEHSVNNDKKHLRSSMA